MYLVINGFVITENGYFPISDNEYKELIEQTNEEE